MTKLSKNRCVIVLLLEGKIEKRGREQQSESKGRWRGREEDRERVSERERERLREKTEGEEGIKVKDKSVDCLESLVVYR